jgi:hypothetical protein
MPKWNGIAWYDKRCHKCPRIQKNKLKYRNSLSKIFKKKVLRMLLIIMRLGYIVLWNKIKGIVYKKNNKTKMKSIKILYNNNKLKPMYSN